MENKENKTNIELEENGKIKTDLLLLLLTLVVLVTLGIIFFGKHFPQVINYDFLSLFKF